MHLTVVLGTQETECFDIILNQNPFVEKWVDELKWCLEHCEFQQQEAFAATFTPNEVEQILKNACVTINKYLKNFIEIRESVFTESQEYLNYLHLKFEQLSGGFDNPTRLFAIANLELKTAIRNLNFYVHRVEEIRRKQSLHGFYVSFNKDQYRRKHFDADDYQHFEFSSPPGTLFLHYVELGKEFIDLFEDKLPISYVNAKNLHYYSGEAFLRFSEYDVFETTGYKEWISNNGFDPYDKTLGHGKIPLGHIENVEEVKRLVNENRQLKQILIK